MASASEYNYGCVNKRTMVGRFVGDNLRPSKDSSYLLTRVKTPNRAGVRINRDDTIRKIPNFVVKKKPNETEKPPPGKFFFFDKDGNRMTGEEEPALETLQDKDSEFSTKESEQFNCASDMFKKKIIPKIQAKNLDVDKELVVKKPSSIHSKKDFVSSWVEQSSNFHKLKSTSTSTFIRKSCSTITLNRSKEPSRRRPLTSESLVVEKVGDIISITSTAQNLDREIDEIAKQLSHLTIARGKNSKQIACVHKQSGTVTFGTTSGEETVTHVNICEACKKLEMTDKREIRSGFSGGDYDRTKPNVKPKLSPDQSTAWQKSTRKILQLSHRAKISLMIILISSILAWCLIVLQLGFEVDIFAMISRPFRKPPTVTEQVKESFFMEKFSKLCQLASLMCKNLLAKIFPFYFE